MKFPTFHHEPPLACQRAKLIDYKTPLLAHREQVALLHPLGDGKGSELATGGMSTKLSAAKIATSQGCDMIIANGKNPQALYDILDGIPTGTRFLRKGAKA